MTLGMICIRYNKLSIVLSSAVKLITVDELKLWPIGENVLYYAKYSTANPVMDDMGMSQGRGCSRSFISRNLCQ